MDRGFGRGAVARGAGGVSGLAVPRASAGGQPDRPGRRRGPRPLLDRARPAQGRDLRRPHPRTACQPPARAAAGPAHRPRRLSARRPGPQGRPQRGVVGARGRGGAGRRLPLVPARARAPGAGAICRRGRVLRARAQRDAGERRLAPRPGGAGDHGAEGGRADGGGDRLRRFRTAPLADLAGLLLRRGRPLSGVGLAPPRARHQGFPAYCRIRLEEVPGDRRTRGSGRLGQGPRQLPART